jgi:hypothetical protein
MIEKQKIIADSSACIAASTLLCVRAVSWVDRIRTITAFTRNILAGCRNKPMFAYLPFCSDKEIRTLTVQILKLLPLPIGLHRCCTPKQIRTATCTDFKSVASAVGLLEYLYHLSDSNRYYLVPKTNASANWAKVVNKKASRSESGGFSKLFVSLKFNQYKISCRSQVNNLTIRDYIDFCLPLWVQIYKHKFIVQIKTVKMWGLSNRSGVVALHPTIGLCGRLGI